MHRKCLRHFQTSLQVYFFQNERFEINLTVSDGDSLRLFVKALDAVNNEAIDSVIVHVDTSPPDLNIIGLTKDGHKGLAVHNVKELYHMRYIILYLYLGCFVSDYRCFFYLALFVSDLQADGAQYLHTCSITYLTQSFRFSIIIKLDIKVCVATPPPQSNSHIFLLVTYLGRVWG